MHVLHMISCDTHVVVQPSLPEGNSPPVHEQPLFPVSLSNPTSTTSQKHLHSPARVTREMSIVMFDSLVRLSTTNFARHEDAENIFPDVGVHALLSC